MTPVDGADTGWGSGRFALISPHSGHARKDWPLDRYVGLCLWLAEVHSIRCLITGDPTRRGEYQQIFGSLHRQIVNTVGRLTFPELLSLLPRATLVVTNDSALSHYAARARTPTFVLFSAAHAVFTWGPQQGRFIALQATVPCRLCSFRIEGCDHDHLCMKLLTLEMAQDACGRLLGTAVAP